MLLALALYASEETLRSFRDEILAEAEGWFSDGPEWARVGRVTHCYLPLLIRARSQWSPERRQTWERLLLEGMDPMVAARISYEIGLDPGAGREWPGGATGGGCLVEVGGAGRAARHVDPLSGLAGLASGAGRGFLPGAGPGTDGVAENDADGAGVRRSKTGLGRPTRARDLAAARARWHESASRCVRRGGRPLAMAMKAMPSCTCGGGATRKTDRRTGCARADGHVRGSPNTPSREREVLARARFHCLVTTRRGVPLRPRHTQKKTESNRDTVLPGTAPSRP